MNKMDVNLQVQRIWATQMRKMMLFTDQNELFTWWNNYRNIKCMIEARQLDAQGKL